MIKRFLFFQIWIIIILFANAAWCADKISGSACYTYGDNESLVQAEQMTKTLAIRNAIESYSTFIESTTKITDFQLSTDLINTVSTGQVKGVKVLKRLESGRKLCYTIEGFVEPKELKAEIKEYLSGKNKISDVRLQENGWIRIVDHFVENLTPEAFYGGADDPMVKIHKDMVTKGMINEDIIRKLHIKIEFLKPCNATTRMDTINEKPLSKKEEDIAISLSIAVAVHKSFKKEEVNKIIQNLMDKYPDEYEQIFLDLTVPKFRCDYHIKVFATFFSSEGYEIGTEGEIPSALWKSDHERKKEMLPGETSFVSFLIPDNAKSWKVWVPK